MMMLKLRNACWYVVTLVSAMGPFTSVVRACVQRRYRHLICVRAHLL